MQARKQTKLNNTAQQYIVAALLVCFLFFTSNISIAQENSQKSSQFATGPHIEVALLNSKTTLVPGESIELGILFSPEKEWHTYWQNPGDSGEAPTIEWSSDSTLSFGEINWPLPKSIPVAHLVNYGYEGDNLLISTVNIPDDLAINQTVKITADISWLVCKEDCIPGWATLSFTLTTASTSEPSEHYSRFQQAQALWPAPESKQGRFEINDEQIVFEIENIEDKQWQIFPFRSDLINHAALQTLVYENNTNTLRVLVPRSEYLFGQADTLKWLISDGNQGFYVKGIASESGPSEHIRAEPLDLMSLFMYMGMAFLGGVILNLMPCVLPILSIKAIALQNIKQSLGHKTAYLIGVLVCFNLFAALIMVLQLSGQQVGWGFHMQEPVVVVLLAFLFTFIALVLLDALAVGGRFAGVGQKLVEGDSITSHFATGTLAVIVASPCTAPFMAAALGIALISEPYVSFLLFNALAIGFALPLTLLFMSKRALSWLPKPGAWMLTFKHFLAFPMLATVAWLCWVFAGQLGSQAQFALIIALILFSMFAWLLGQSSKGWSKLVNNLGLLLSIGLAVSLSLSAPTITSLSNGAITDKSGALQYSPFSEEALANYKQDNKVVVVNMTADWCITCKVNEQIAFSSDKVKQAFDDENLIYMVGDWTNKNQEILSYLTQYERAGVPLYVVYSGNKSKQVLPQILTPDTIIQAINQAKEELTSNE